MLANLVIVGCGLIILLVIFGSLSFRTARVWPFQDGSQTASYEGAAYWAGMTFGCGLLAAAILVLGCWVAAAEEPDLSAMLAVVQAMVLGAATLRAHEHWMALLAERERPRDYELAIADGLPVVTVASAIGVCLSLLLSLVWIVRSRKSATTASPRNTPSRA